MAVAVGKVGSMFLMNEDALGGYSTTTNNVLGTYSVGNCWCGPSYFVDPSDGLGRVVTSGGHAVQSLKVQTSPKAGLVKVSQSPAIAGNVQDPGFFTSISSNGTASPIIWALSRPTNSAGNPIYLYAFDPENVSAGIMHQLFRGLAGTWPNTGGNSNLVPLVANGEVFVASHGQLRIFGLKSAKKK
jgi:hypothetical protein